MGQLAWLRGYAAAAAKSLQSCLTLCNPIDGSPPGSPIPGILQARTLEWVAISFSNAWKWKVKVKLLGRVRLLATTWTAAHQAPPSMGFSRQEHWNGLPFPSLMHESEKWKWSHSVVSDSLRPHGLQPTRLLRPWDFPGKRTGVGCHCLHTLKSESPWSGLHLWLVHTLRSPAPGCYISSYQSTQNNLLLQNGGPGVRRSPESSDWDESIFRVEHGLWKHIPFQSPVPLLPSLPDFR